MWKREKRAAVANVATKAAAAALGWGGHSTGGLGGGAHAAACTSFRGRKSASTCAAPASATVQRGARAPCCRRNGRAVQPCIWQPPRPKIAAAFHRAARHVQRAHCARLLARGNKTPDARSEVTAHCGKMDTGVRRAGVVTAGHSRAAGEAEAGAPRKWRAPALRNDGARATRTISRASVAKKTTHRVDECGRQGAHGKLPRFLLARHLQSRNREGMRTRV